MDNNLGESSGTGLGWSFTNDAEVSARQECTGYKINAPANHARHDMEIVNVLP